MWSWDFWTKSCDSEKLLCEAKGNQNLCRCDPSFKINFILKSSKVDVIRFLFMLNHRQQFLLYSAVHKIIWSLSSSFQSSYQNCNESFASGAYWIGSEQNDSRPTVFQSTMEQLPKQHDVSVPPAFTNTIIRGCITRLRGQYIKSSQGKSTSEEWVFKFLKFQLSILGGAISMFSIFQKNFIGQSVQTSHHYIAIRNMLFGSAVHNWICISRWNWCVRSWAAGEWLSFFSRCKNEQSFSMMNKKKKPKISDTSRRWQLKIFRPFAFVWQRLQPHLLLNGFKSGEILQKSERKQRA